jgi:hypothetical protein
MKICTNLVGLVVYLKTIEMGMVVLKMGVASKISHAHCVQVAHKTITEIPFKIS